MESDPCRPEDAPFEVSVPLPYNYALSGRIRPSTVRKTALMLLPWALWYVLPQGRLRLIAFGAASRYSPLLRGRLK